MVIGFEIGAGNARVFRADSDALGHVDLLAGNAGDGHAAAADAQVHDFVDVSARRLFDEDVLADDTHIGSAAFDVDGDVRRLDQGHFKLALGVLKDELAAFFGIRREIIAAFG